MDNFCKLIVYDTSPIIDSVILRDSMEYVKEITPNSEIIDVHVSKDLWKIIVLKPEDVIKTKDKVFIISDAVSKHRGAMNKLEQVILYTINCRRHLGCQFIIFAPFDTLKQHFKIQVDEVRALPELDKCIKEDNLGLPYDEVQLRDRD